MRLSPRESPASWPATARAPTFRASEAGSGDSLPRRAWARRRHSRWKTSRRSQVRPTAPCLRSSVDCRCSTRTSRASGLLRRVGDPDLLPGRAVVADPEDELVLALVEADADRPVAGAVRRRVLIEPVADVLGDRYAWWCRPDDIDVPGRGRLLHAREIKAALRAERHPVDGAGSAARAEARSALRHHEPPYRTPPGSDAPSKSAARMSPKRQPNKIPYPGRSAARAIARRPGRCPYSSTPAA